MLIFESSILSAFLTLVSHLYHYWNCLIRGSKSISRPLRYALILLLGLGGCGILGLNGCSPKKEPVLEEFTSSSKSIQSNQGDSSRLKEKQKNHVWAFVGDSLTAGFGVTSQESYVSLLEKRLKTLNPSLKLVNAGVSGDTSAGVLRRLDWILQDHPQWIFLCIGANDGLRGLSLSDLEKHLETLIDRMQKVGSKVVLMGMKIPPNYGPIYTKGFADLYARVAQKKNVPFLPFLLEGVAGEPTLNQSDGIHPNPQGHQKIALHVFDFIQNQKQIAPYLK